MHGGDIEMHFRDDALHLDGHGPPAADDPEQAEGHHHGFRPDGQYPAFRHVPIAEQPHGSLGDRRRDGRTDADALRPGHRGSLDAGRERTDYQYARLARQLQADVHVGRKHLHHDARPHVRFAREMNTLFDTPSLLSPNNHPEKSEARFISPNDDWEKF